jgi:hypothetical protein
MKNTGSLYDSETCLIFDFGSSEGKSILCTFCDGRISSTELCKYDRLEDFILEKNGKTKDEMKREIIIQAQEVSASLIVIGTTSWHRDPKNKLETDRFLRDVEKELKKTKIKLVINFPEGDGKSGEKSPQVSASPLHSHLTPMEGTSEARYETTATMYAAESYKFKSAVAVTHGSGGGSTQISIVDSKKRNVIATVAEELGSRVGVEIIKNYLEKQREACRNASLNLTNGETVNEAMERMEENRTQEWLREGVAKWRKEIEERMKKWELQGYDEEKPKPKHVMELTQEESKNSLVIGISAVYYGFSGSRRSLHLKDKEEIPLNEVLDSLQHKLHLCINAQPSGSGFATARIDDSSEGQPIRFKNEVKWFTEISNVAFQHTVLSNLYHESAKFYFAREWQVKKSPFRTTWSTGWFIEYLRYRQVLRFGRIALVIRMTAEETTCFIRREAERDEVNVPLEILEESQQHHGKFRQLEEYFHQGDEGQLIAKIQGIMRSIHADAVVVELDSMYHPNNEDKSNNLSNLSKHAIFGRLNCSVQKIPWKANELENFQTNSAHSRSKTQI